VGQRAVAGTAGALKPLAAGAPAYRQAALACVTTSVTRTPCRIADTGLKPLILLVAGEGVEPPTLGL
jgi:hypothetical protein